MAYETDDVAVYLEDLGGTVTASTGETTQGLLVEADIHKGDGQQQEVLIGTARLIIARGSLPETRQGLYSYQEDDLGPTRTFRLREPVHRGAFTHLVVVEETA